MPLLKKFTVAVITGGSSGIGESFIKTLLNINPEMLICNISRSEPADFLKERVKHFPCDISDKNRLKATVVKVEEVLKATGTSGPILLINNSGFGSYGPFPAPSLDEQLDMIGVNIEAMVHLTGLLLPLLKARGGAIINVASTAGFSPTPYMSTYGATKAFVLNWSLALSCDLKADGIDVLAVCPGPTATQFFMRAGFHKAPLPEWLGQTSDAVAKESLKALQRKRRLVVCGFSNKILTAIASHISRPWLATLSAITLEKMRMSLLRKQRQ